MIEIKDLLSKWSEAILSGELKKGTIKAVLEEVLGVNIKTEEIEIKNNIIYLNIKPIYKNQILLKKEKIDLMLSDYFKKNPPQEIR